MKGGSGGGGGGGGGGSTYSLPAKRRWRLIIGVFVLVMLSMLVPFVFLLGFHNSFHSTGYAAEQHNSQTNVVKDIIHGDVTSSQTKDGKSRYIDDVLKRLTPEIPEDITKKFQEVVEKEKTDENNNEDTNKNFSQDTEREMIDSNVGDINMNSRDSEIENRALDGGIGDSSKNISNEFTKDPVNSINLKPSPPIGGVSRSPDMKKSIININNNLTSKVQVTNNQKGITEESEKSCEVKYGSYCLWRQEHREEMKDAMVKKLKDQLFVARAYYPSVAKLPKHEKLTRDLKQNIQELERIFSEASTDSDLPPEIEKKSQRMEGVIAKSKSLVLDCANVEKKLRQLVDLTEDEANFHMKQSAFLYQISVQTMPKSHHCLFMRLTVEYFKTADNVDVLLDEKYMNPDLHHYVLISRNILAASTVINSTVMHAKDTTRQVFHVLTDKQNYFSMKMWFYRNNFKEAAVQVLNIEDLELASQGNSPIQLSLPEEFRISFRSADSSPTSPMKTEYLSLFSHSHYLLPEIFHYLKKIIVLDDDVVVKQDLSPLWSLSMKGKVNGAVQNCRIRFSQLKSYFGSHHYDSSSCAWTTGLNVLDLVKWRESNITGIYKNFLHTIEGLQLVPATLRANLLSFQNQLYSLDDTWVISGLGHDYGVDMNTINNAAVLHYSGNMKPWLDLGIHQYKDYWKKYLNKDDLYLSQCNVNS